MSIFEVIMLLCFGAAWPLNIYKSLTTKSVEGKSVLFLYAIEIGYVSGIIHKYLYSRDIVMALYVLNFTMVFTDILLYYRNLRLHQQSM